MNSIDLIKKEVTFASPIEKVWAAITEPTQLSQWFGNHAVFELREGAMGYFEWTNICKGKYAMQIKSIRAPYYFAWYWMYDPDIKFELEKATLVE